MNKEIKKYNKVSTGSEIWLDEFFSKLQKEDKTKFKCLVCNKILIGKEEVNKHKEKNFNHFEYEEIETKFRLGFV